MVEQVNINPQFLRHDDIYNTIHLSKFIIYIIISIQLLIIFFIFYYFFFQELYTLYNYFFYSNIKIDNTFIDKISQLQLYNKECRDGRLIYYNLDKIIYAKYFDNTEIKFDNNIKCIEFINLLQDQYNH